MAPKNLLLARLPEDDRNALISQLSPVSLRQHAILFEPHEMVSTVFFPEDAMISLVVSLSTGEAIEAAMVGRDGMVGASAAMDSPAAINRGVVRLGGAALQCHIDPFKCLVATRPNIRSMMVRYEQALMAQTQQCVACNTCHKIKNRLARWLLMARDLHGADELSVTQEYLAEMLGVRRTSVCLVAHTLQQAGMLRYARGHIRLLNIDALKETACECYEAIKLQYDALLHPSSTRHGSL